MTIADKDGMKNKKHAKPDKSDNRTSTDPNAKDKDLEMLAGGREIDYDTVPGDPIDLKRYTLQNGLNLYMSVNDIAPRIYTNIAVKAGSKHDPPETTGLAHYLEHMMFKGTDRIGALAWEKEKEYLQQISALYERHRLETDPEKRTAIYAEIDRLSSEAARLAAANEYDKLVSALGARGTNAYTWVEQTVYLNDIPSNELERWMKLESERFKSVTLRLFHTELETVYEEFNMNQDRDFRKVSKLINETLYPSHPYGLQTTIGKGEHLKNPSHVKIQEYFRNYYSPNNMAIILAGDFNPDEAVVLAEKYFGNYETREVPDFTYEPQPELTSVVRREVYGQEGPYVQMAWRFDGADSKDADYLTMIYRILYNRRAGLIDLNLVQAQRVLEARAAATLMKDFSTFQLYGKPREGQNLEDVEQLLLAELENIRQGDFEDWLIEASIRDLKLSEIRANESNNARAGQMTSTFVLDIEWKDYVNRYNRLESMTKDDIMRFARKHFKNNYVVVYKRYGKDPGVIKVDKPNITPVDVNRKQVSAYTRDFLLEESPRLEPVFIDYQEEIESLPLNKGLKLDYIRNTNNETFILDYIVEMGNNSDRELAFAISYLPYLGTDRYTSDQLKQEFFRLGLNFNVNANNDRSYITLSGLDESLEEGIALFEHILSNVTGNQLALDNLIEDQLLKRENAKKNKQTILRTAMYNYARYGQDSPFTNNLSASELKDLTPALLVNKISELCCYDHHIFYYGSKDKQEVARLLNRYHQPPGKLKPVLPARQFTELPTERNRVIFVDFPMVQSEIMLVSKGTDHFDLDQYIMSELYNAYFGAGLSSIVFQEIRESRALAYSAFVYMAAPVKKEDSHYLRAYIGTQPDKMAEAINAIWEIIENMPLSEEHIEQAVLSIQKKVETGRLTKDNIYWSYLNNQRLGLDHDIRKDVYERMQHVTMEDLRAFHNQHIKGRHYTILVLGSRENIDFEYLGLIGPVRELSLEDVFGETGRA